MSIRFLAENHKYESINQDNIEWISATTLLHYFKQPFKSDQAKKSSKNKKSKWYGMTEQEVLNAWATESKRATDLGTWYHNQREDDLCELDTIVRDGLTVPVFKPSVLEGIKYAPKQNLINGIYPEHLMYLKSAGICGQSDLVEVLDGKVNITDYKTNKEIKTKGYTSWDGLNQKMLAPVNHLEDCHINHYNLQLSIYMYIILKHNPGLRAGKLIIQHIAFEELGRDKFDYPITAVNSNGDPIVKNITYYELPYLKEEVLAMMNWLKDNKHKLTSKHESIL